MLSFLILHGKKRVEEVSKSLSARGDGSGDSVASCPRLSAYSVFVSPAEKASELWRTSTS